MTATNSIDSELVLSTMITVIVLDVVQSVGFEGIVVLLITVNTSSPSALIDAVLITVCLASSC